MDPRAQFGLSLQRLRRERDLSQEEVAGVTEIDRAYVGRLERGEANPTLLMLARIALAFQITLSDLLREVELAGPAPESSALVSPTGRKHAPRRS
jgi:transcriptional regulator with XRE-family HTH domain